MYRSLPLCIIFTIITCGIYGLYWFVVITDEVNELSGNRNDTSGIVALLFTIVTCGLYGIYWAYRMGIKIGMMKRMYGGNMYSDDALVYLLLSVFALQWIVYILVQNEINRISSGNIRRYNGYGMNSGNYHGYYDGGNGGNYYGYRNSSEYERKTEDENARENRDRI